MTRAARAGGMLAAAFALTLGTGGFAHADGDGNCVDTGNLCVYDGSTSSGAYYDLNDPHPTLAGLQWFDGGTGDVNDDISSIAIRGGATSCYGFDLYQNTNYTGWSLGIAWDSDPAPLNGIYDNAASSFKKSC